MMNIRPLSLILTGWFLILAGGLTMLYLPFSGNSALTQMMLPETGVTLLDSVLLSLATSILCIISGSAVLAGKGWGRGMYLFITPVILLLYLYLFGLTYYAAALLKVIIYAIIAFALTRKNVTEYVNGNRSVSNRAIDEDVPGNGNKILSICCLIVAGVVFAIWLMMTGTALNDFHAFLFGSAILWLFVVIFGIPGLLLWDKKRTVLLIGGLLAGVGVFNVLMGLLFTSLASNQQVQDQIAQLNSANSANPNLIIQLSRSAPVTGIIALFVGAALILYQRRNSN